MTTEAKRLSDEVLEALERAEMQACNGKPDVFAPLVQSPARSVDVLALLAEVRAHRALVARLDDANGIAEAMRRGFKAGSPGTALERGFLAVLRWLRTGKAEP